MLNACGTETGAGGEVKVSNGNEEGNNKRVHSICMSVGMERFDILRSELLARLLL